MAKAATKKPPTKTEVYASIAESTGVPKKDVAAVFDAMVDEISKALSRKGSQASTIPGRCKIGVQHKPAEAAKKGVPKAFKPGELMDVAAKPAKNVVKVRGLKKLKDVV